VSGDAVEGGVVDAAIVVRDADGAERTLTDGAAFRSAPAFSPDGATLAYVGDGGLSVVDLAGRSERLAPCRPPACLGFGPPAWSPDGGAIALGMLGERTHGLALVDVNDPTPSVLATEPVDGKPAWSPDGTELAFASGNRIVVVDAGDGDVVSSTGFPGRLDGDIAWSPDGATFAVDGTVNGETGIFLVRSAGSGPPELLSSCPDDGCTDLDPAWSPDGTVIVFTRGSCDLPGGDCFTGDLFVVEAAGGVPEPLVTGPTLDCCASWGTEP
jgi:Tol biopolymer transport system component